MAETWPAKVSRRSLPGATERLGSVPAARPTCASPITSGAVPNSLLNRTRSVPPPMLRCTVCRIVWSLNTVSLAGGTVVGTLAQLPTQVVGAG